MRREGPLDVPPQPVEVDEAALIVVLQGDLVAVLRQQAGELHPHRAQADRFDLQEGVVVGAFIDVTIGMP